jgi:hypothetical protein
VCRDRCVVNRHTVCAPYGPATAAANDVTATGHAVALPAKQVGSTLGEHAIGFPQGAPGASTLQHVPCHNKDDTRSSIDSIWVERTIACRNSPNQRAWKRRRTLTELSSNSRSYEYQPTGVLDVRHSVVRYSSHPKPVDIVRPKFPRDAFLNAGPNQLLSIPPIPVLRRTISPDEGGPISCALCGPFFHAPKLQNSFLTSSLNLGRLHPLSSLNFVSNNASIPPAESNQTLGSAGG